MSVTAPSCDQSSVGLPAARQEVHFAVGGTVLRGPAWLVGRGILQICLSRGFKAPAWAVVTWLVASSIATAVMPGGSEGGQAELNRAAAVLAVPAALVICLHNLSDQY